MLAVPEAKESAVCRGLVAGYMNSYNWPESVSSGICLKLVALGLRRENDPCAPCIVGEVTDRIVPYIVPGVVSYIVERGVSYIVPGVVSYIVGRVISYIVPGAVSDIVGRVAG